MLKVSEIFYSLQGEGRERGTPSVFIRLFGCNFTCAGFSMPRGQLSTERMNVDPKKFDDYKKLPLVHTGCDSYASWDPRFKHLSKMYTEDELVEKTLELIKPNQLGKNVHVIITGGEPLLKGWQKQLPVLIDKLVEKGLTHLTFETNGSQKLSDDFATYLASLKGTVAVTFSISSKLPSSGEKWEEAIVPEIVQDYVIVGSDAYFKWVVSNKEDLEDVQRAEKVYKEGGVEIPIYLMPAGGTLESYEKNERWVADLCRDSGYRFSDRLQVPLYKNAWGT